MRVSSVVLAFLLSAVSAGAQLGPELAVTSEPAQFPATIQTANHQLTAWIHPATFEVRAMLDGAPLPVGQSHEFATAPVLAANDTSFLVVWLDPEKNKLFGRRIALNRSFIDAAPIAIGSASYYTSNESIVAFAEGSDYLVWWATEKTLRVARLAGDTSTLVAERSWTANFSTPQIRAASVPGETTRVFYGDDRVFPGIICDPVACWNGFFGAFEPDGAGSIGSTELLGNFYQAGPVAVVSDHSRFTLLWWGTLENWTQALFAAQLSPDLELLTAPKVVYRRQEGFWGMPPALHAVWNGTEMVAAWNSVTASVTTTIFAARAIRLTQYADAIDHEPFDIAAASDPSSPPSVIATASGVLFTYAVIGDYGVPHSFTRTLDRLPVGPPRQRAVRH